ncbi:MAG: hypothetical protein OIN87_02165, partial [Candidatus Methanoperedens sp.]|nr:hypothetical protein [Candidatus Methanoperedens sp.]
LHFNSAGHERIAQAIKDSFRFIHGKQGLYNLIQSDGTIIYSANLSNAINTSWRMASKTGAANVSYNIPSPGELANFTVNSGIVDRFNIGNIEANLTCELRNNTLIESRTSANGSLDFTIDLSHGTYFVKCMSSPILTSSFTLGAEINIGIGQHPGIATSQVDGTMHIVYVNNGLRYRSYNPTTGSLGSEELVSSGEIWGPQIAVSSDGDVHVVWEKNTTASSYIGYSRRVSGVWKSAVNLNPNSPYRAMMPRIDVDSNNRAHVVFWKNIKGGTLPRGQYNRINKVAGLPNIELTKDISGWENDRFGDIVVDNSNIPHIFSGQVLSISHWTVSESGVLNIAASLPKPSDTNIEKFMEGISVATGAGGDFYGFSKDAGSLEPKEVFHTRIGGPSKIVWNSPAIGKSVVAAGDLVENGRAYAIFAGEDKKGRVLAIDGNGSIIEPILFADAGNQHDGIDRHGPGGAAVAGGGLYVVYQDDRSGTWQVYIRKVSTGNALPPTPISINVTSPNGAEDWAIGTTHMIIWSSSGNTGTDVKIELLKSGVSGIINLTTENDGSYSWTIPVTQTPGTDYQVRVT